MIRKWMVVIAACVACFNVAHAGIWDTLVSVFPKHVHMKPVGIRVLLMHNAPGTMLGVTGKYKVFDPNTNELISTRFVGKRKYIEAYEHGVRWHEEFPGIYQLLIVPDDPKGMITINDVEYRGSFYVYNIGGAITVINELSVEDYLNGLLSGQYYDPLDQETLAAIAIAARTEVLFQAEHPKNAHWVIDARAVGYKGHEHANPSSQLAQAISETKGMALIQNESRGGFFPARWGSALRPKPEANDSLVVSRITVEEADQLAKAGSNAMELLFKAFPGTKLHLIR